MDVSRAHALHRSGRLQDAERLYREILVRTPRDADACNLLGLLCLQTGRAGESATWIERALAIRPDDAQAHYNLGIALLQLGRHGDACRHFGRCTELDPGHVEGWNSLGNGLRLQGEFDRAESALRRVLSTHPSHAAAHCNLGLVRSAQGRLEEAVAAFRAALRLEPRLAAAREGLGACHLRRGNLDEARRELEAALQLRPASAGAHNSLGVLENRLRRDDRALVRFEQAVAIDPRHAEAWLNLGIGREQSGDPHEAERCLRRALAADERLVAAWFHLCHLRHYRASEEDLEALERAWTQDEHDPRARTLLAFARGLACASRADHDQAFPWFAEARRRMALQVPFCLDDEVHRVERIMAAFPNGSTPRTSCAGGERLIFVAGMPRSGTTLAEQVLASHPLVHGAGETGAVGDVVDCIGRLTGEAFPAGLDRLTQATVAELRAGLVEALCGLAPGRRVVDTTPMNFYHVGVIRWLVPGARIVHCVREPADTCLSIYQHPLHRAHAYANRLEDLGDYYRLYQRLMDHWRGGAPDDLHDLCYERLVTDPEPEIRRLLEFCGLPFDPACLRPHETDRVVRTPSASQVRQPIHGGAVGRWRPYARHLRPLLERLGTPAAAD